jgi:hypothetical protein
MKLMRSLAAMALAVTFLSSHARAQAPNPSYLAEFPSAEKVMTAMATADPDETAARQMAAFTWLMQMIPELAGPRQFQRGPGGGFTPDENKLRQAYSNALYAIQKSNPKYNTTLAMHGLQFSLPFRNEMLQKAFPPGFAAEYPRLQAQARQAAAQVHQQAVQAAQPQAQAQQQAAQKALDQAHQQFDQQQQEARMDPQSRQMRRCITAGRVMAVCVGNGLMGSLMPNVNSVLNSVAPGKVGKEVTGPQMAGVFAGAGWRLEFSEASVALSCQDMVPDSHAYTISFVNNRAVLDIASTPKDVVLTVDGATLTGASSQAVNGRVALGMSQKTNPQGRTTDVYKYQEVTRTCARPVLTASKSPGVVGAEQNMLVSLFNDGDAGPQTPVGLRMNGTYAAPSGFSVQFFPESVILGCGPDVARAYPYAVIADGREAQIKVGAPDHPLTLVIKPNNVLDPGSGPYEVHGRQVTGQDANDDYTFAPRNATCNLAPLSPGPIPSAIAPVTAPAAGK